MPYNPFGIEPFGKSFQYRNKLGGQWGQNTMQPNFGAMDFPLPQTEPEPQDEYSRMRQIFAQPPGPAQTAYQQYIQNAPQIEQPSWGRRILAGIAGAATGLNQGATAGARAAEQTMMQPYMTAMQNWQVREPGMRFAAVEEERRADNERQALVAYQNYLHQKALEKNAADTVAVRNRGIDVTVARDEQEAREAQARLEHDERDLKETGAYHRSQIDIDRDRAATARIQAGASVLSAQAAMFNAQNRTPGEQLPTQQKTQAFVRANELKNQRGYSDDILTLDATNNDVVFGSKFSTLPQEEQNDVFNRIYGKETELPPEPRQGALPPPSAPTAAPPKRSGQKVKVRRSDGVIGNIPIEQLQSALAQGYTQVK